MAAAVVADHLYAESVISLNANEFMVGTGARTVCHRITRTRALVITLGLSVLGWTPVQAHQGMPNSEAKLVCKERSLGEACEWSDAHDSRYIGTCRKVTDNLLCVRNKPIVYSDGHSGNGQHAKH